MPPGLLYVLIHSAFDEYNLSIGAPGPTKVNRTVCYLRASGKCTAMKYISISLTFRSRCCCNITIPGALQLAMIKKRRRPAKNEINRAFNIAIFEILIGAVPCVPGVLVS